MGRSSHLWAIVLLPGTVTVVVPTLILSLQGNGSLVFSLPFPARLVLPLLGLPLLGVGLALMVKTIGLFATVGRGTLAPWTPTQRLVVRGIYRHVRNPMISGVCCVLLGEAVCFGSLPLVCWSGAFWLVNAIYIPLWEEPGLVKRFGRDYVVYRQNVPRWIPRFRPWEGVPPGEQDERRKPPDG